MKAYQNKKGQVLAVFKIDCDEPVMYSVYIRANEKSPFNKYKPTPYKDRYNRQEAEMDMAAIVQRSTDKTWREIKL